MDKPKSAYREAAQTAFEILSAYKRSFEAWEAAFALEEKTLNWDDLSKRRKVGFTLYTLLQNAETEWERVAPCAAFEQRFGAELHDLYREKHPIDGKTKVEDDLFGNPTIHYVLPLKIPVRFFSPDGAIPVYIPTRSSEARFEWLSHAAPETWVKLAYAPEINTVFVQDARSGRK